MMDPGTTHSKYEVKDCPVTVLRAFCHAVEPLMGVGYGQLQKEVVRVFTVVLR